MIYHYTSTEVLCKLLVHCHQQDNKKSMMFWASSAYAMSDLTEMQNGYDFLRKFLNNYEENMPEKERLCSYMTSSGDRVFSGNEKVFFLSKEKTPFVVSFSMDRDSYQMWELYGDKGKGVCLVFDEDIIKEDQDLKNLKINYHAVAYMKGNPIKNETWLSLGKMLRNEVRRSHSITDLLPNEITKESFKRLFLSEICPVVSAFIKTGQYSFENEYRILSIADSEGNNVHFRVGSHGHVIPYIDLPIPLSSLHKVIVGPNLASELSVSNLEHMLRANGSKAEIDKSDFVYHNL